MLDFFRKLTRRSRKISIIPQSNESLTIVSEVKDEIDKIINDDSRFGLLTLTAQYSWQILMSVDEKGRLQYTKPRHLQRTLKELRGHELLSKRMYELDPNDLRRKNPYWKIYTKGKIKCSVHFPLLVGEMVIGEFVIYTRKLLNRETIQILISVLEKHKNILLEVTLAT